MQHNLGNVSLLFVPVPTLDGGSSLQKSNFLIEFVYYIRLYNIIILLTTRREKLLARGIRIRTYLLR